MATIRIRSNAEQLLRDSYRQGKHEISFMEWLELESEGDPDFWRWLFDDGDLDGEYTLTDEHKELYKEFLENLCE